MIYLPPNWPRDITHREITGGVRSEYCICIIVITYGDSGLRHPLAPVHVQTERTAETVHPVIFCGRVNPIQEPASVNHPPQRVSVSGV